MGRNEIELTPEIKYDVLEEKNPKMLYEQLAKTTYDSKYLASKLLLKKVLSVFITCV